jgi:hypothetical protein
MFYAKDIITDWAKVGTMLLVSRWLTGDSLMDTAWQKTSLYMLLGFTAYHLSTRNFVDVKKYSRVTRSVINDTLYFGTMLFVAQVLAGGSVIDPVWIAASLATLFGLVVYNVSIVNYINGNVTSNKKLGMAIDDWAKFGTMLLVSRLVSCESILDPKWAMSSLGVLIGFSAYDLVVSHAVDWGFAVVRK